jgi:hypothetical protein
MTASHLEEALTQWGYRLRIAYVGYTYELCKINLTPAVNAEDMSYDTFCDLGTAIYIFTDIFKFADADRDGCNFWVVSRYKFLMECASTESILPVCSEEYLSSKCLCYASIA